MACCSSCEMLPMIGLTMGAIAPECDKLLPTFVVGSTAEDLKRRLDPAFQTTNAAVKVCQGLSAEEKNAWAIFFASWQELRGREAGFWDASAQWDMACALSKTLEGWQTTLADRCKLPGPKPSDVPTNEWPAAIKWVAAALFVGAVVYGVRTVVK